MQSSSWRHGWEGRASYGRTALLLSLCAVFACSGSTSPQAQKSPKARAPRVTTGNFRVATECTHGPVDLVLKTGVRAEVCRSASATGHAELAVAPERVSGQAFGGDFVPVGPTFTVVASDTDVACSYAAESYEIMPDHQAVVAVSGAGRTTFVDARYETGHFRARVMPAAGARFQFGLAVSATPRGVPVSHSAAP